MDALGRAVALHRAGRLKEAAAAYVEVLRRDPRHADALHLLGMVMSALGHADEALDLLDRAVAADPRHAAAHANRGVVLLARGRTREAVDGLRRAVALAPELADAHAALGAAELRAGEAAAGLRALGRALELEPSRARAIAFADACSPVAEPPGDLVGPLAIALATDGVDHSRLDRAIRAALAPLRDDPAALAAHPLVAPWLRRTVVAHPDWERALVRLRRWATDRLRAGEAVSEDVFDAIVRQVELTEGAWADPDPPADDPRARPLFSPAAPPADDEPVPELFPADDPSSAAVRAMYEESPYPRWVSVHLREPQPLAAALRDVLPEVHGLPAGPIDVLVAGCGTGRHALQSAIGWSGAKVLAVDLSAASLRVARRTARRHGVDVEWARADLLALGGLTRRFDVVESVGVLHHLADPLAGWRVLRELVRPGGLMRVGLYSERGRADVVAARALVAEWGLEPTPAGIVEARRRFLALPSDHPAAPIAWSPDFYSLSGCRDLVFHVREHRYTPARLASELAALDLELLGLQHALPQVSAWYRERWPDDARQVDLDRWEAIEREHPRAFSGMYVLWARPR